MSTTAVIDLGGPLTPEHIGAIEARLREVRRDRAHEAWPLWEDVGAYLRAKRRSYTPATFAEAESTLVRLVTPPGGTVLDPFTGSGTTGIAALREGFLFIGCEREPDYIAIARQRICDDAPLLNTPAEVAA